MDLSDKPIIICSIVRNAEKGLRKNIPIVKELCKRFKDYKVFVYENDSTDNTKRLLEEWASGDAKHVFVSLNNNDNTATIPSQKEVGEVNRFYSVRRIEKMARLRNYYLDFVEQRGWTADYLMVVDLDVARLTIEGILSSFESKNRWDAVTAFGYSLAPNLRKRYHDTYALTEYGDEQNPQTMDKIRNLAGKYGSMRGTKEWIRVYSAFGGLAIYRFEAIKGLRYFTLANEDEHVEVRCEHYSIYKQMASRGFDRVYINPEMELKYQSLNMNIIVNHIKRMMERKPMGIKQNTPPSRLRIEVFHCIGGDAMLKAA